MTQSLELRTRRRAYKLIETLLMRMQRCLNDPILLEDPVWEQIFGAKQNMASNLHKLVQALGELPVPAMKTSSKQAIHPEGVSSNLTEQELNMLSAWLRDEKRI